MTRLAVTLLAAGTLLPAVADAAELTRLASSFELNDPFGMYLDASFERTQHRTKIVREFHQNSTLEDVNELRYVGVDNRLNIDLKLGLYQDLEFSYRLPIVFQQSHRWRYSSGTDDSNSTIANNCVQPNGALLDPSCPDSGAGKRPLFDVTSEAPNAYRAGMGDMSFGLAYAFFNQRRDDTKPTWVVAVDYTAPTSEMLDPTFPTATEAPGRLGDKNHKYRFSTSLSRRIGAADPYFQLHYTVPVRGPGWYSNCDNPDPAVMGFPQNCGQGPWTRSETGIKLPHVGGFIFGSEFNAYDEPARYQKFALDLRGIVTYVSEGRYFNEMSDLFGKLLYTQEYLQVGGQAGFTAHAAEYVHLKASATLLYNTEHNLTDEQIGKDLNDNGSVDITQTPEEVNPNFDWRTDMVSRRFRAAESTVFRVDIMATFAF